MRAPGPHGPGGGDPRLSLRFMATGICALLALGVLLVLAPQRLTDPEQTFLPATIALVHVAALGMATSVMIGVLYHFLPAVTGSPMRAPAIGRVVWWLYTAATLAFIVSLAAGAMTVVPVAAGVLGAALALFLGQCADCLLRARRRGPGLAYHAAALVSLAIVAVTGIVLAVSLDTGLVRDPLTLLGPKIVLALGGWVGLIVTAVSYRIVPVLNRSPARPRTMGAVLALMLCSLVAVPVALVIGLPPALRAAAMAPYAVAGIVLASDVTRIVVRAGALGAPTGTSQTAGAIAFAVTACAAVPAVAGIDRWPAAAVAAALAGVVPILVVGNGNRIARNLAAIADGAAPGQPVMSDVAPAALWHAVTGLLVAGWLLTGSGVLTGQPAAVVTAGALLTLASAVFLGGRVAPALLGHRPLRRDSRGAA